MDTVTQTANSLAAQLPPVDQNGPRCLIAIAGAPASGKSTLAEALVTALGVCAVLLPMDGFHLDDSILKARGLLPRKGAPETFDVAGLSNLIKRARTEEEVFFPTFDRSREISLAGSGVINPEHRIVVAEGNYFFLPDGPWASLAGNFDNKIFLEVPEDTLKARLLDRWRRFGFSEEDAEAKALSNDLPNARLVARESDLCGVTVVS